jgi:acetoin utilization deacetylase AcuC-like enzyme
MEDLVLFYPEGHDAHFERGHPERPERLYEIRSALKEEGIWEKYPKVEAITLEKELVQSIHSFAYLNVLEMTCRRGGHLDPDTYTTPATWSLAHQAAGGAVAVASAVYDRNAVHGFALTRPPGHHAMRGQGMGFCLLNNIAIAAEYLIQEKQVKRLAIIDIDLHHGNGTQDIFYNRDDVFYVSTHQSPFYPGTGKVDETGVGQGEGWTANFPLPPGSGDTAFLTILSELIIPLLDLKKPEMILVSYGFDSHWLDPLGQLLVTAECYRKMIRILCDWAKVNCEDRLALILEGGYDLKAAKVCSQAVANAMLGNEWQDSYPCPYTGNNAWVNSIKKAQLIWNL